MLDVEFIRELLLYYARFVPQKVLIESFVQLKTDRPDGYDELVAELSALPDDRVISDIDTFVFSINEKYLSDRIRNNKGTILFVEYSNIVIPDESVKEIGQSIYITVAGEITISNNDMYAEMLKMSRYLDILNRIISYMDNDQRGDKWCNSRKVIVYPCNIQVVDPRVFYDRAGWSAEFKTVKEVYV